MHCLALVAARSGVSCALGEHYLFSETCKNKEYEGFFHFELLIIQRLRGRRGGVGFGYSWF